MTTTGRRQITRELRGLDTAHRIQNHEGKCRRLHGHRYRVLVTASAPALDAQGRVVDFSVIEDRVGGWLQVHLDHGTVLQLGDRLAEDLVDAELARATAAVRGTRPSTDDVEGMVARRFVETPDLKLLLVDFPPTAENLAEFIYVRAVELLAPVGVTCDRVTVYETPTSCAHHPPCP